MFMFVGNFITEIILINFSLFIPIWDSNFYGMLMSHDLNHITNVCERIVVLKDENIVKEIKTNPKTLEELEGFFTV